MSRHLHPRRPLTTLALTMGLSTWGANAGSASAQNTQVGNQQAESIRGVVVNSLTREPIGRALVYSPDNRFATMTNAEGRFEFTFSQPDTSTTKGEESGSSTGTTCTGGDCKAYTLSRRRLDRPGQLLARKPGFLTDQSGIQNLQQDTAGKDLTIALIPEALVVGRVVLPTSEPSDEIQLEIYRRQVQEGRAHWIRADATSTKSSGEFRFADLAAGSYKLLTRELLDRDPLIFDPRGQLYGYPPVYFPNATDFAAAQTIQLTAGQIFQADISLVRHPYYSVKVAVTNVPLGGGINNVVVSPLGHRSPGFALGYNDRDQRIEGLLPVGGYTLEASSFGTNGASGLLNISVKGAAVEGPRMTLVPNGSINVSVKEEFTASEDTNSQSGFVVTGPRGGPQGPRRYLNVRLEPADDFAQERGAWLRPPTASAPEDDTLVIEGVQPGRYWVKVDTSRGFVASISSGTTDLQHHLLVVGIGGSSPPIEITMRDGTAELTGTIEGAAVPGALEGSAALSTRGAAVSADGSFAHVYCVPLPDSSGEFKEIWVAPDGQFGPQQMPPGTYRVLAFDRSPPEFEYRNPEAMRAYDTKGQVVRLVAGQKEHLQLQLISSNE